LVFVTLYRRACSTRTYSAAARTPREGLQRHRRGEMGHEALEAYTEVKMVTTQL
jgi:hypothetical protein